MWIHGYFHLLGYDHKNLKSFQKMNKKEKNVFFEILPTFQPVAKGVAKETKNTIFGIGNMRFTQKCLQTFP